MSRLPAVVFAMLAMASAGAFFVVQHLKSTTPLIAGFPAPDPAVFNPRAGVVCTVNGKPVDFSRMRVSFYLLHRSDDVDVYMIDQSGDIVATLASGRHMVGGAHPVRTVFTWNGREDNGRFAPDGTYFVRVDLIHQGRTYVISPTTGGPPSPVKVETRFPRPVVTSVSPGRIPGRGRTRVVIRYTGSEGHYGTIRIYRTDLAVGPRLVESFQTPGRGTPAVWDGTVNHQPAPAGVYLIGLDVTDAACNTGHFPRKMPPTPGTTRNAGVSVRYLTATAPLEPIRAGATTTVRVGSAGHAYTWALRRPGSAHVLTGAAGSAPSFRLTVPRAGAGVYELRIRTGADSTTVPVVVSATHPSPLLVVLPALTWQGSNPVDDTGDGLPNTLVSSRSILLDRPLVNGRPAGLAGEEALLDTLRRDHHRFDLTTDLALIRGAGPPLSGHRGVILAGSERWITPGLGDALRAFVSRGGTLLSLGTRSLRAYVRVRGERATNPGRLAAGDLFGVRHTSEASGALPVLIDDLGLFTGDAAAGLSGIRAYEPAIAEPGAIQLLAGAGPRTSSLGVVGLREGTGNLIEVGVTGFTAALPRDPEARALLSGAVALMTG